MKEGLGRAVESFSCEWVSSYERVLSWLRVLRHFSSCSYVWFLRVFAGVVYVSSYSFLASFHFGLLAYLKQPSVVKGRSRSHLLFKACGTFSPEEKLFIYSCINCAGTYQ